MHTHPKVAAVASQNWPFRHDAKCEPLLKFLKANIHEASSDAYPLNLPTRVREDPEIISVIVAMKLAYPIVPHMDYARPLPVVSLRQDAPCKRLPRSRATLVL